MKKTMKVLLAAFLFTGILQGCSSNNNETTGKEKMCIRDRYGTDTDFFTIHLCWC